MIVKSDDLLAILPFTLLVAVAIGVLVVDLFHRRGALRSYQASLSAVGLGVVAIVTVMVGKRLEPGAYFDGMVFHDGFGTFLHVLFLLIAAASVLLSPRYLQRNDGERGEYYGLVLLATSGMMLMASAGNLLMLFLGIEIMSMSVYVLVGFFRQQLASSEASLKYFFLGAFASALFLYGMALIYGTTGSLELPQIGAAIQRSLGLANAGLVNVAEESGATSLDPLFFIGMLLLLVALAFKIALVPFHMWTPDAYTGAPTAVVGFMATAVKAAGFAALIRVLFIALGPEPARIGAFGWVNIFYWLAAITIVVGNLLAIAQNQLKRMLAYSSIAHAGYALVGVLAAGYIGAGVGDDASLGHLGNASVLFYLAAYALGVLGAFGLLSYLNRDGEDVQTYDDLDGFGVKHPALGLAMTVFMLSSAGFPATAGFVAKFFVFESAVTVSQQTGDPSFIYLVVLAVLASVAGAYYYLRVVVHMYMRPARGELGTAKHAPAATVIAICALGALLLGLYPSPVISQARKAMDQFQGVEGWMPFRGIELQPGGLNAEKAEPDEKAAPVSAPTVIGEADE